MRFKHKSIYDEMGKEQLWFAWYPVVLDTNPPQEVWLEKVIRVRKAWGDYSYIYRPLKTKAVDKLKRKQ